MPYQASSTKTTKTQTHKSETSTKAHQIKLLSNKENIKIYKPPHPKETTSKNPAHTKLQPKGDSIMRTFHTNQPYILAQEEPIYQKPLMLQRISQVNMTIWDHL